ncbi:MAG: carboxypeptidase regulatory-like domain-containing protein [Janthinobacterium lividum]
MSRRLALLAATIAACSGAAVHAQFRASIQGTVTDPQGAVIPGANVMLTDVGTGRSLTAISNASGTYNFNALAPDHYTLTATARGFQQQVIRDLTLIPEQANAVNVQLTVGDTSSTVNVSGDQVATLDTETASISGTVSSNEIQHLPSAGRDVFQLVQLAPGVFGDGSQAAGGGSNNLPGTQGPGGSGSGIFATENGPQANANGGQYETNNIQIDGISTVSAVWGGTSTITPTEDSVGSVKIVSNAYDAENGRFSGAQIQVTSKTGTNQFHGSLFFRASRPGLNAYQRYNGAGTYTSGTPAERGLLRDTQRSNQDGGSIGGPILHDKLFFFFAYETTSNNTSTTGTGWYETAQFRALASSGSPISQTFLNFPGSAVAASGIIPQTCANIGLVEDVNCRTVTGGLNLGSPLVAGTGRQDLTWTNSTNPGIGSGLTSTPDIALYSTLNPTESVGRQYNGRLDSDVTKKDHLAFAIYWVPQSTTDYNGSVRSYNLYHHSQVNDAYSIIYNHTFSPTFLNEARANDSGWRWNEIVTNPQEPFGLPTDQVDAIGSITLASFGAPGPSNFNQHSYDYKDVATKIAGNHTIKFGGDVTRLYYLNNPTYSARPSYNFYNVWDFLNDAPHTESGSFSSATGAPTTNRQDNREDLYGFFVQDDWKARPNLTLNMGLRYSYFGPFSSKENNLGVVQFGSGAQTFTGLNVRTGGNLTQAQKGNFGPQFGFAYSPSELRGKAVIRGGFGLNFNQTEIAITGNAGSNPPFVTDVGYTSGSPTAINADIVYAVPSNPYTLFDYPANPHTIGGYNTANLPTAGGATITGYQAKQPTIYTQHYSLETEYDLGHQLVASVAYQGSTTRHLIVQSQLYVNGFALGYAQNPLVENVDYYANAGHSNNNSLLLGFKKQMSHGVLFDAEFNYAKSMDTGSGPYYEDPYPYRPDLAYGPSDFNFGKAFKLYGLWQPHFTHGKAAERLALDGWSISDIFNQHTGFPFTPYYNVGSNLYYANSGYSTLRPALYNGGAHTVRSNNAYEVGQANLNFPSAGANQPYFALPATGIPAASTGTYTLPTLPGVARNSFTGPGYLDLDATVAKSFVLPHVRGLGETPGLEIRADAFNVFNNVNLSPSSVVTNLQLSTFGQAQSALGARVVNLQARFNF